MSDCRHCECRTCRDAVLTATRSADAAALEADALRAERDELAAALRALRSAVNYRDAAACDPDQARLCYAVSRLESALELSRAALSKLEQP